MMKMFRLTTAEKLEMAMNPNAHRLDLYELAKDRNELVVQAVFMNENVDTATVKLISRSDNSDLRAMAVAKFMVA